MKRAAPKSDPKHHENYSKPARREASPEDLERLAHWLDTLFEIPLLRIRFGIDSLLGLLPGFGDTATTVASVYILQAAMRFGVSRITIARMTLNIIIDLLLGAIPFVGDLFDFYWKANRKNVELLRRHLHANPAGERKQRRWDWLFVGFMIFIIFAALIASIAATYWLLAWLFAQSRAISLEH